MNFKTPIAISSLLFCSPTVLSQVITDGSVGAQGIVPSGQGATFHISEQLGKRVGNNLLHSFQEFSLNQGESALFSGDVSIDTVIARVTGNEVSEIHGKIHSQIPDADLFLANKNGVVIGQDASISVNGAFYVTTADFLQLADGEQVSLTLSQNTQLTSANPQSFGFLGSESFGEIRLDSFNDISLPPGNTFGAIAGEIIINNSFLDVEGVDIFFASQSVGHLPIDFDVPPIANGGNISITQTTINTNSTAEHTSNITLLSGNTIALNESVLKSTSNSNAQLPEITMVAPFIDILSSNINVDGVQADAGSLSMLSFDTQIIDSEISASSQNFSYAGSINITTLGNLIVDNSNIDVSSETEYSLGLGQLNIKAQSQFVVKDSLIQADHFGQGKGSSVNIVGNQIALFSDTKNTGITANRYTSNSGATEINILANEMSIFQGAQVQAAQVESGEIQSTLLIGVGSLVLNGGGINTSVYAASVNTADASPSLLNINHGNPTEPLPLPQESIMPTTMPMGPRHRLSSSKAPTSTDSEHVLSITPMHRAGNIIISSDNLVLNNGAQIQAVNLVNGFGGDISIIGLSTDTNRVRLTEQSAISTDFFATNSEAIGQAGSLFIKAGALQLDHGSFLSTSFGNFTDTIMGTGNAGNTLFEVGKLEIDHESGVFANNSGWGDAGDIIVDGGDVALNNASLITSLALVGSAGDIKIDLSGDLHIHNADSNKAPTQIISSHLSAWAGDQAVIDIAANNIIIDNGAQIIGEAVSGYSSNVQLTAAQDITVSGRDTLIASQSFSNGSSGSISLMAGRNISVMEDAAIITYSEHGSSGDVSLAGFDVLVDNSEISISNQSDIPTKSRYLNISATNNVTLTGNQTLITAQGRGQANAGVISIQGGQIDIIDGAQLAAQSAGSGLGGRIDLNAEQVLLSNSIVKTSVLGAGDGQGILIQATDVTLEKGAGLFSTTDGMGRAGNIDIYAFDQINIYGEKTALLSLSSDISVSSYTDPIVSKVQGDAGNINLIGNNIVLSQGATLSSDSFTTGNAGEINVKARDKFLMSGFANQGTLISSSNSSSSSGNGGVIKIQGFDIEITGSSYVNLDNAGTGTAPGELSIIADNSITVAGSLVESSDAPIISTHTSGNGVAANLLISSKVFALKNNAIIKTPNNSLIEGQRGLLHISATEKILLEQAHILNKSEGKADSNDVRIEAPKIVLNNSSISGSAFGSGQSSNIDIASSDFQLINESLILNHTKSNTKQGGNITVTSDRIILSDQSLIDGGNSGQADSGNLYFNAASLKLNDHAYISSHTDGEGNAGDIYINVNDVQLTNNSYFTASAEGESNVQLGNAGDIHINSDSIFLEQESAIFSATTSRGNAGNVVISTDALFLDTGAIISTSSVLLAKLCHKNNAKLNSSLIVNNTEGLRSNPTRYVSYVNPKTMSAFFGKTIVKNAKKSKTKCLKI